MASSETSTTSERPGTVSIVASPTSTLMHEVVNIEVTGLQPDEAITLRTYFDDERKKFESHAHYRSDINGKINTSEHQSEGGHYCGKMY